MIEYAIGLSGQILVLENQVIQHFQSHRQTQAHQKEAGGQLFARIEGARIVVCEATGPRKKDKRTRTGYLPDRSSEQEEINERFSRGLHFIGDWHTHPEDRPAPSELDRASIKSCFGSSKHELNGFLLIIVGRKDPPDGLFVSIQSPFESIELSELVKLNCA